MLKFYHAPWSRSSSVFWLMEELGVPYEMELVDIRGEDGAPESYRAIQPNKKVPAVSHDGVIVTERAAISIYLADAFPETGLAPAIGDPDRAAYLTTLVYCDSVFDPAVCARVHGLEYVSNDYPFGTFDAMLANLEGRLSKQPYAVGDRFTAADIQLATGINYTMNMLRALPERQVFHDYVARVSERPAYQRATEKDASLAATIPFFQEQMQQGQN